jgi:hypothetical protein
MCALYDGRETTILETPDLLVKGQAYHAVLTSQRIILTGEADNTPRSIRLQEVWRIGQDTDPSGDPVIAISIPSAGGTVHSIILHFPLRTFPNAFRLRDLWAAELTKLLQQAVPGPSPVTRPASQDALAFCSKCGNQLARGSSFCNRCGSRIPSIPVSLPPKRTYPQRLEQPVFLNNAPENNELAYREQIPSSTSSPRSWQTPPIASARKKKQSKKQSFFSGTRTRKTNAIIGICLVAIIIVAVVILMGNSSELLKGNSTSTGPIVSLPDFSAISLPVIPVGNTETSSENSGSPAKPVLTFTPDDPGAVLATYPSLFNKGDGAGIQALLSENMRSHYPLDMLNTELAAARSNGYSIAQIQVHDQTIEEGSAVLDADIIWKTGGSSTTSSTKLFLVNEDNQWKLDSLELHP